MAAFIQQWQSSCEKDRMVHKAENIYYLAFTDKIRRPWTSVGLAKVPSNSFFL